MPKVQEYVEYNDDGAWSHALVTGEGDGGPGNYNLLVKSASSGGWEPVQNVPEGTASGHWREP